jgi:hypothetical protein
VLGGELWTKKQRLRLPELARLSTQLATTPRAWVPAKTAPSTPQAHGREALTTRVRADEPSPDGRALPSRPPPPPPPCARSAAASCEPVPAVPRRSLKYELRQSPRHACLLARPGSEARGCGDTDSAVADWFTFTRNCSKLVPLLFTTISSFGVTVIGAGGSKILETACLGHRSTPV